MILNKAIYKRDAFLTARVPREVKEEFEKLATASGKSKSEFLLDLVLKELDKQNVKVQSGANNTEKH